MPAAVAFWATGVSASPSNGRMTSTSGLPWIRVSIWSACSAEPAALSLTVSSTSPPSSSPSPFALSEIAFSQPWSAAGELNAILTGPSLP
jgi:hypothetical protein